jgi:hypothetical protein
MLSELSKRLLGLTRSQSSVCGSQKFHFFVESTRLSLARGRRHDQIAQRWVGFGLKLDSILFFFAGICFAVFRYFRCQFGNDSVESIGYFRYTRIRNRSRGR